MVYILITWTPAPGAGDKVSDESSVLIIQKLLTPLWKQVLSCQCDYGVQNLYPLQYKNHSFIPSFISKSQSSLSQIWWDWKKTKTLKISKDLKMERLEHIKTQWKGPSIIYHIWSLQDSVVSSVFFEYQFLFIFCWVNYTCTLKYNF